MYRKTYLQAKKNDKPAISRTIVRKIRENNGRFLKKNQKSSGLWFEIGDDAAREKTSQALRQRAPEIRKLLFRTEHTQVCANAEEQLRQQGIFMGGSMSQNMINQSLGQGEEQLRQQGIFMGGGMSQNMINQSLGQGMNMNMIMNGMADTSSNGMMNPVFFQNMVTNTNGLGGGAPQTNQGYTQMYSAPIHSGDVNNICSI
jgi:hypothetical protein